MESLFPVQLPSKGKPYGIDAESVKMKILTGEMEEYLAEVNFDNFDQKTHELLNMLVVGVDVKQLTLGDRLALLIQNRINSYTPIYPISTRCTNCLRDVQELAVDLTKLDIESLPEEYTDITPVALSNDAEIGVKLFRIADELAIKNFAKDHNERETSHYRLARSLVIEKMEIVQKCDLVKALPARDRALIREVQERWAHGIKLTYDYVCPHCEQEATTPVPFRLELLLPDGSTVRKYPGTKL